MLKRLSTREDVLLLPTAGDILTEPKSRFVKEHFFRALLSDADAEEALVDDGDPYATVSLMKFLRYRTESPFIKKVRNIALHIEDFEEKTLLYRRLLSLKPADLSDLSDPAKCFELELPSVFVCESSPQRKFLFIGRPEIRTLFEEVRQGVSTGGLTSIDFSGPPGLGKSYILAALGSYILRNNVDLVDAVMYDRRLPVRLVYILGERYAGHSFECLRSALLVAFEQDVRKQAKILAAETIEDLARWCQKQKRMVFLVDGADCVDSSGEAARDALRDAACLSCTVWCASKQSAWAAYRCKPNQRLVTLERPFNAQELTTWLSIMEESGKLKSGEYSLNELLYYTGYTPMLLACYAEQGIANMKTGILQRMYSSFLINMRRFSNEDMSMLELVLCGGLVPREVVELDPAFFYVDSDYAADDNCRVWCRTPYIEEKLRAQVNSLRAESFRSNLLNRIDKISHVILLDAQRLNPARMGWMVDGVIRDALQAIGKLAGMTFRHSCTYHQRKEHEALSAAFTKLPEGVLFLPIEFNAQAIDAVLAKLEAGVLIIVGIQITVASWKRKEEKDSHSLWLDTLSKNWTLESKPEFQTKRSFIYILSDVVRASKVANSQNLFRVLKFSDIHQNLAFIDNINLPEPEGRRQCKLRCNRFKVQQRDDFYCFDHQPGPYKKAKT